MATTIDDRAERSTVLDPVVVAQIAIDPSAARDTLRLIPKSPKKLDYLTALAAAHAESGNIAETERIYADIVVEDQSSHAGKLAAANALGQVAVAYAIKGNVEEASNTLSRVKERFPMLSRATVYNTLNLFVEKGLLRELVLAEGKVVFDPKLAPHHHFIDEETQSIVDIPWDALQVKHVDALRGFDVREYQVVLRGRRAPTPRR